MAGGAGAVGHFAIELAKFSGARVAATVSGPQKAELAKQAGADLVVNYRDADAADQLRGFAPRWTGSSRWRSAPTLSLTSPCPARERTSSTTPPSRPIRCSRSASA